MSHFEKKLQKIKENLYTNQEKKGIRQFFQSSILHFAICLEIGIGTLNKNYISYEKLCEKVPKKFGSRSTIQSILNDGVNENYFTKSASEIDKRIKIYILSDEFIKLLDDWIKFHENEMSVDSEAA